MSMDNVGKILDKGASEKPHRPIASSIMIDYGEIMIVTGLLTIGGLVIGLSVSVECAMFRGTPGTG